MQRIRITRVRRVAADPAGVVAAALGSSDASRLTQNDLEMALSISKRSAASMHASGSNEALVEVACGHASDIKTISILDAIETVSRLENILARSKK